VADAKSEQLQQGEIKFSLYGPTEEQMQNGLRLCGCGLQLLQCTEMCLHFQATCASSRTYNHRVERGEGPCHRARMFMMSSSSCSFHTILYCAHIHWQSWSTLSICNRPFWPADTAVMPKSKILSSAPQPLCQSFARGVALEVVIPCLVILSRLYPLAFSDVDISGHFWLAFPSFFHCHFPITFATAQLHHRTSSTPTSYPIFKITSQHYRTTRPNMPSPQSSRAAPSRSWQTRSGIYIPGPETDAQPCVISVKLAFNPDGTADWASKQYTIHEGATVSPERLRMVPTFAGPPPGGIVSFDGEPISWSMDPYEDAASGQEIVEEASANLTEPAVGMKTDGTKGSSQDDDTVQANGNGKTKAE